MRLEEPVGASWKAKLALGFESRSGKTVLAERRHEGPLVVQKPLYPEGAEICHAVVVHPPGGIAGGDELDFSAAIGAGAHALITNPGAAKWYRSAGPWARQRVSFDVNAVAEWLPQETIVYDAARADLRCDVELAPEARFLGWEVLCLGRGGSGERFTRGEIRLQTQIRRDGKLVWFEQGRIPGGGKMMRSEVGLGGRNVCATLLACAPQFEKGLAGELRSRDSGFAITHLPGVLVARHLGDSSEEAKRGLVRLWSLLRPALCGREAVEPRIWRT